jgi:2-aminoadipate transaminase
VPKDGPDFTTRLPLPLVQFVSRPGIIDLGWGHPDPELLPVHGLKAAATRVFDRYGVDTLNYGYPAGPGPLIAWLSGHIQTIDGRRANPDEISITAGTSQAIDQVTGLFTRPGDVVLIDAPTYYLAIKIFREHPVELVRVASDEAGISVEDLRERVRSLRAAGRNIGLLYTVPTFNNPTGVSISIERRSQLVEAASDEGFVILEDDAYRELSYDAAPPPSLWSMAPPGTVIRLGSFAKSLAPGLRCGFITADPRTIARIRDSGVLDSGGAISHFAALVVAEFASDGEYARHVENLRSSYRKRRDALLESLAEHLTGKASWTRPAGGYFAWLKLVHGTTTVLLEPAEANGMSFLPGGVFDLTPSVAHGYLRLSFSRYSPEELREAVRRLCIALPRDAN